MLLLSTHSLAWSCRRGSPLPASLGVLTRWASPSPLAGTDKPNPAGCEVQSQQGGGVDFS